VPIVLHITALQCFYNGRSRGQNHKISEIASGVSSLPWSTRSTGSGVEDGELFRKYAAELVATDASTRTTQLSGRREDRVTLDEVVKTNIRG